MSRQPPATHTVEFLPSVNGRHIVVLDGFMVPKLAAVLGGPDENITLETPEAGVSLSVSQEIIGTLVWFVANAMANAAGFTCFGAGSAPYNSYAVAMSPPG